jgi:hypothetical protein
MNENGVPFTYEIQLKPGEKLTLPESLTNNVSVVRWLITVQRLTPSGSSASPVRLHDAFLRGYAPEDEGLYDRAAAGLSCE